LGKPVKFQKLPLPLVRLVLGREFYLMFRWFNHAGLKPIYPVSAERIPRCIFMVWKNGCETKAGTSVQNECALPRSRLGESFGARRLTQEC
jgi:hypothetical protein